MGGRWHERTSPRFRWPILLAGAACALSAAAHAGPPDETVQAAQAAAGLRTLEPGAIRFTAIRPRGAGGTIYEARRGAGGVTRTTIDLSQDRDGLWSVDGRETVAMAAETLDYFAARIDAAIAARPPEAVCPGQPVYYAEHGDVGIGGGCGPDHPDAAIARALGLAEPVQP